VDEAACAIQGSEPTQVAAELIRLESLLLDPVVRGDKNAVAALLTDDFREFGSSGTVYDKVLILDQLAAGESGPALQAAEFAVVFLGLNAALLTYRSSRGEAGALRSAVWVRRPGAAGWQMLFHQGTRCP